MFIFHLKLTKQCFYNYFTKSKSSWQNKNNMILKCFKYKHDGSWNVREFTRLCKNWVMMREEIRRAWGKAFWGLLFDNPLGRCMYFRLSNTTCRFTDGNTMSWDKNRGTAGGWRGSKEERRERRGVGEVTAAWGERNGRHTCGGALITIHTVSSKWFSIFYW